MDDSETPTCLQSTYWEGREAGTLTGPFKASLDQVLAHCEGWGLSGYQRLIVS